MQCNAIREELPVMIRVFPDSASAPSRLLAGAKLRKGAVGDEIVRKSGIKYGILFFVL